MVEKRNEIWIVWEILPDEYAFTQIYYTEEEAKEHCRTRRKSIVGTEMEGRDIYYGKYVRLV